MRMRPYRWVVPDLADTRGRVSLRGYRRGEVYLSQKNAGDLRKVFGSGEPLPYGKISRISYLISRIYRGGLPQPLKRTGFAMTGKRGLRTIPQSFAWNRQMTAPFTQGGLCGASADLFLAGGDGLEIIPGVFHVRDQDIFSADVGVAVIALGWDAAAFDGKIFQNREQL